MVNHLLEETVTLVLVEGDFGLRSVGILEIHGRGPVCSLNGVAETTALLALLRMSFCESSTVGLEDFPKKLLVDSFVNYK